jgi:hypothetical protein
MLGWKPDQMTDLKKMRNNIWNEVSGREANAIWWFWPKSNLLDQTVVWKEGQGKVSGGFEGLLVPVTDR